MIIMIGLFAFSALATLASGLVRAMNGRAGAWAMFSWSVSLVGFPLVAWGSFDTLVKAWP
jgi:hypothetical protein